MNRDRILIVDDNAANLKVARLALEGEGFEVRVAEDAEAALAVLGEFRPGLILMDIQLPGIDGLELTRRLKADAATHDIVIVAVTAFAMKGDREKALAAGCDGYIAKPIDPIRLPEQVAGFLSGGEPVPSGPIAEPLQPRILVIEDNPMTMKMMRLALETDGYEVVAAFDARMALEAVADAVPDLIVQDLVLPDMDGLELVRRLRHRLGSSPVPILCVSGLLSRVDEARAAKGGFAAVIIKPVDPLHLLQVIRFHLAVLPPHPSGEGRGRRLLVVDDDPLQRKLAELWFAHSGFQVVSAADGREALDVALRERPDAIVSDVLMPVMDGFDFCLAVRRDPRIAATPLILISSAYVEEEDHTLARRVGANAFLSRTNGLDEVTRLLLDAFEAPAPPPPSDEDADIIGEHAQRAFWQLERQVQQNAGLARRCTLQATQLAILAGITDALAHNGPVESVLDDLLAACLDMAGISKGVLYTIEEDVGFTLRNQIGFADRDIDNLRTFFGQQPLFMEIARGGEVVIIPSSAVPEAAAASLLELVQVSSLLMVPVTWSGVVYGAMLLGATSADVTGNDAQAFARVLGGQLGQAINLTRAFRQLKRSEARFRSLVRSMQDTVFVLDRNGRTTGAYGRADHRHGRGGDEFVGHTFTELLGPEGGGIHDAANERAVHGESVVYEWSMEDASGPLYFHTAVSPVRDDEGRIAGAVRVTRDMTEQNRLQTQLMVSDRLVSVGTLAAGVAHEINNPLTAVAVNLELALGALDGIRSMLPDDRANEVVQSLRDANEAASRVQEIVRDLKVFSRAEEDTRAPIDVHRVLDSSVRLAWNEIRHRAQFVRDYGEVPPVMANEGRLGQVFLNLVINAAQAIPVGRADDNEIRVTTRAVDADRVVIEVMDTGPGIPADVLPKIFTPFFTTKPTGVGTGLGLAICQRIIAGLGGNIEVESVPGGTTFRVTLPVIDSHVAEPDEPDAVRSAVQGRRGRILVVDDDPLVGGTLLRVLRSEHDVTVTDTADDALKRIADGDRFDVILCDLMMPVVTGMDFHARLSEVVPDQADRIVFLTGGAFTPSARAFLDRVRNERLEKPFETQQLRAFLRQRLSSAT